MGKFWCWLFGHKYHMVEDWAFTASDVPYIFYCERCEKTAGKKLRN